jgi:uncharacterized protein (DUF433 family)
MNFLTVAHTAAESGPASGGFRECLLSFVWFNNVSSYHPKSETAAMSNIDRADLHRQIDELSTERLAVVERSPDVLGGLLVFRGTRVPVSALLDYLAAGDSLDKFIDDFPSVRREQAIALLELTRALMST